MNNVNRLITIEIKFSSHFSTFLVLSILLVTFHSYAHIVVFWFYKLEFIYFCDFLKKKKKKKKRTRFFSLLNLEEHKTSLKNSNEHSGTIFLSANEVCNSFYDKKEKYSALKEKRLVNQKQTLKKKKNSSSVIKGKMHIY
jgi:hypothetical protein